MPLVRYLEVPAVSPRDAIAVIVCCLGAIGAVQHASLPVEEAVRAEAEEKAMAFSRLSDPTRPQRITDCPGEQYIAWQDPNDYWKHACVNANFNEEKPL